MKKKWIKPELEVLEVNMTMGDTDPGEYLDNTFEAGTYWKDLTWRNDS
jgi:hypothetical protein|nr:paeninodin family lasso peptide [Neobacillus sp. Marseille-Q6967]